MRKELLQREVLHTDETVVQVLKENGKTAQSKSYTVSASQNIVLAKLSLPVRESFHVEGVYF